MRTVYQGWRTAASRTRAHGTAAMPMPTPAWTAPVAGVAAPAADDRAQGMPWQNVGWTISLIGLLVYVWVTTTYTAPLGQASMVVALAGLAIQREPLRVPRFLVVFGAFVAWCAVGYVHTDYPAQVSEGLNLLWKIWLIALVVVNAVRTRPQQRALLFVLLAAFAMYPFRGAIFNYLGGYTLWGRAIWNHAYANPNDLAAFTLLNLGFAAALLVREPKGWPRLAAMAGVVLLPFLVLLTQSRGAFLGLAVAGLLLFLRHRRNGRALMLAFVGVVGLAIAAPDSAWDRLAGIVKLTSTETLADADWEGSARQRFAILQVATDVFQSDPVNGVGFGAYAHAHERQAALSGLASVAGGKKSAHNTYLTVLAETGIIGGLLYATMLGMVLVRAERVRRRARERLPRSADQILFLELGLLAFLIAGVFGSFAHIAVTYTLLSFLWVVSQTVDEELTRGLAVPIGAR